MAEPSNCLDDNAVSAYLEHQLSAAELDAVVAHLASCEPCLAIVCAARSDAPAAAREIDRFTIEELIGQTATTDTYRAVDPRSGRTILLDVIHAAEPAALRAKIFAARSAKKSYVGPVREVLDHADGLLVVRDPSSPPSASWVVMLDRVAPRARRRWPWVAAAVALAAGIAVWFAIRAHGPEATPARAPVTAPTPLVASDRADRTAAVIAALAGDRYTEVVRDGRAMLAELSAPRSELFEALASACVLIGRRDDALATLDRLARSDAGEAAIARADLAAYEGRLTDARALLGTDPRSDLIRSELAARGKGAASATGIGEWAEHYRHARAALAANDLVTADTELTWCLQHPGMAALAARPSLRFIPEVAIELARCKDARHLATPELRAAYQQVVRLGVAAQNDSWTEQARARLKELAN
jgi:hypothetical protein